MNTKLIPKTVLDAFNQRYPDVLLRAWYVTHLTYWQNDYSSNWYTGWYHQRTVVVYHFQKPNYFEVEFVGDPGETSRAIYNIYGQWYETRTQIKSLTKDIYNVLKGSKYSDWQLSSTMEKIESSMWPVEIYRFHLSKGIKSHIVRMDAEGNLIQVKELNE